MRITNDARSASSASLGSPGPRITTTQRQPGYTEAMLTYVTVDQIHSQLSDVETLPRHLGKIDQPYLDREVVDKSSRSQVQAIFLPAKILSELTSPRVLGDGQHVILPTLMTIDHAEITIPKGVINYIHSFGRMNFSYIPFFQQLSIRLHGS